VLDLNVLPFNCIVETNFHSKLIFVTVAPMICVALIYMYYRLRLAFMPKAQNAEKEDWKALCIRVAILFVLTIFPPVSTTIFQTFSYDKRLGDGSAYLKADYSIEYNDEQHQHFIIYAIVMGIVYCMGIPLCSFFLLYFNKDKIQELQVLEHSQLMLDDLINDKTRTTSVRKRETIDTFKEEGISYIMKEVPSGDITGSFAPESEAMRPEEDVFNSIFIVRDELAAGLDIGDTKQPEENSLRSSDSEAVSPENEAVHPQDAVSNAISSKPQLPIDSSIRNIALRRLVNNREILLRNDPVLKGLSPLYSGIHIYKHFRIFVKYDSIVISPQDFEAKAWWWQIVTFLVTLLLCGPFLLLPGEAASKVFLQLLLSMAMSIALANVNPYIHSSDDVLAQLCQGALSLTMMIGLLDMCAIEFQDSYYGPLLVICTTVQIFLGFVVATFECGLEKIPKTVEKLEGLMSIFFSNPGVDIGILEPQRLAKKFTLNLNHPFRLNKQKKSVAPLPASSVDGRTDGIVSSSEEASRIVEGISKARGATELTDREPHLEPERLAESFTRNGPFTLKNKPNVVAPLPESSVDDTTDRIVSSSEEASWIVEGISKNIQTKRQKRKDQDQERPRKPKKRKRPRKRKDQENGKEKDQENGKTKKTEYTDKEKDQENGKDQV
jgi:hypothetical protein